MYMYIHIYTYIHMYAYNILILILKSFSNVFHQKIIYKTHYLLK